MPTSMDMKTIQNIYIAFYGRPADPAGQAYWAQQLADAQGDVSSVINAFANSDEYHDRYGHLSTTELIQGLYQQVLGREGEEAGVAFYQGEVDAGNLSTGEVALAILGGAQGGDAETLANRQQAAERFTEELTNQSLPYETLQQINSAKGFLENITSTTTTETIEQLLDTTLAGFTAPAYVSFTLDEAEALATPLNSVFADYHKVDSVEVSFSDNELSGMLSIPEVPAYTQAVGERMEIWYVLTFDVDAVEGNDLVLRFALPTEPRSEGSFSIYPLGNFADETDDLTIVSTSNPAQEDLLAFDFDSQADTISFELDPSNLAQFLDQSSSPVFADAVTQMNTDSLSWVQAIGINLDVYSEGNAVHSFIYMLE